MRTLLTTLHAKYIHPSLALPYLAAYCGGECGETAILEFTLHEPKENVLAAILAETPDVVAFSVYLWNRRETLELIDALAVAAPAIRTVVGGPEVSFEGAALFHRHPGLSALVRGEGELPMKGLLSAWARGEEPQGVPRLSWREGEEVVEGPDGPPLPDLDAIPSPFEKGLADLGRGLVYFETSRGCPYSCAFCMSSLDETVRSFSMERIKEDLKLLMEREVPTVKLVDRTFNYDAGRARQIISYILEHNRSSRFHFEIGAHLLDEKTLELLSRVPKGVFQFEIGVQSTLPETLAAIGRRTSLEALEKNVRALVAMGNIHLHLDLIAGLPGQGFEDTLEAIDRVSTLGADHLQVEPVKLLPGAPLRLDAESFGIRFDPNPPYSVLSTPELNFEEIERLRGVSRLLDLTCNSGRFDGFLAGLQKACSSLSAGLAEMEDYWRRKGLLRHPLSQRGVFEGVWDFVRDRFDGQKREILRELLGRDFARSERVVPGKAPAFLDTTLSAEEEVEIRALARQEMASLRGKGIKVQHFAAAFEHLPGFDGRGVIVFLYFTRTGGGMKVEERRV